MRWKWRHTFDTAPGGSADASGPEVCTSALLDEDCDGESDEGCECTQTQLPSSRVDDPNFEGGSHCGGPTIETTQCPVSAGSLTMSVCQNCSDAAWSTCVASNALDFSRFDANAGSGVLEVSFCVDAVLHARVELWYGDDPWRKALLLYSPGDPSGCRTFYFQPQDACFGDFAGLPAACRNRCGVVPVACVRDYRTTKCCLPCLDATHLPTAAFACCRLRTWPTTAGVSIDASCTSDVRSRCQTAPNDGDIKVCAPADCIGRGESCTSFVVNGLSCESAIQCLGSVPVLPDDGVPVRNSFVRLFLLSIACLALLACSGGGQSIHFHLGKRSDGRDIHADPSKVIVASGVETTFCCI